MEEEEEEKQIRKEKAIKNIKNVCQSFIAKHSKYSDYKSCLDRYKMLEEEEMSDTSKGEKYDLENFIRRIGFYSESYDLVSETEIEDCFSEAKPIKGQIGEQKIEGCFSETKRSANEPIERQREEMEIVKYVINGMKEICTKHTTIPIERIIELYEIACSEVREKLDGQQKQSGDTQQGSEGSEPEL